MEDKMATSEIFDITVKSTVSDQLGKLDNPLYVDENGKVHIWMLIETNADRFDNVDIPRKEELEDILSNPRDYLIEDYAHDSDLLINLVETE